MFLTNKHMKIKDMHSNTIEFYNNSHTINMLSNPETCPAHVFQSLTLNMFYPRNKSSRDLLFKTFQEVVGRDVMRNSLNGLRGQPRWVQFRGGVEETSGHLWPNYFLNKMVRNWWGNTNLLP